MPPYRVCLVVDNPLRDLDGLVLVGWHLARMGIDAWLTPMYEQAFDVRAIGADFVLVNYVRFNNLEHVVAYRREGVRVGVLDTEGAGGKTPAEFAGLGGASGGAGAVDLYCAWGGAQRKSLVEARVVPADRIELTGCPRYDYCASPWRDALQRPVEPPGYVLVNTNFPIVNPRFSRGTDDEVATAVSAGLSREFAEAYVRDARIALAGVLALMETLLTRWPSQRFILRPHPFEAHECYRALERHANFALRQEGSSVEWLNQARVLVHLNCSTAVEAAMLGKPALSPAWLDTAALHVAGPSSVSRLADSPAALLEALDAALQQPTAGDNFRACQPLQALYHHIDGHSAERVAQAIVAALGRPPNPVAGPAAHMKSRAVLALRNLLGHRMAARLVGLRQPASESQRRLAKLFSVEQVQSLVGRLQACDPKGPEVKVQAMNQVSLQRPRMASQGSIRLSMADS